MLFIFNTGVLTKENKKNSSDVTLLSTIYCCHVTRH